MYRQYHNTLLTHLSAFLCELIIFQIARRSVISFDMVRNIRNLLTAAGQNWGGGGQHRAIGWRSSEGSPVDMVMGAAGTRLPGVLRTSTRLNA